MHDRERPTTGAVATMYASLRRRDLDGVASSLHPAVVADLAAGLPLGLGGRHRGRDAVLAMWRTVASGFDLTPEVRSVHDLEGDDIVVFGVYEGTARATGQRLSAAFVHRLTLEDRRIVRLEQTTDTHLWHTALAAPTGDPR